MPAPIPVTSRPLPGIRVADSPPPEDAGALEGFGASMRMAQRDISGYDRSLRRERLNTAMEALREAGVDWNARAAARRAQLAGKDQYAQAGIGFGARYGGNGSLRDVEDQQEDDFWTALTQARAAKPDLLKGFAGSREDFDKQWRADQNAKLAKDSGIVDRTPWWVALPGGITGAMTDPVNIFTMPFGGGGRTVFRQILSSGLANAAVELVQQPLVAQERAVQGRDFTLGEAATNVGTAFAGGMALDAGMRVAVKGVAKGVDVGRAGFEKVVAANWDRLPQGLRDRWTAAAKLPEPDDGLLADLAEEIIGRDGLSDAERTAVVVLRREGAIDAASPFAPDGAGSAVHRDALGAAVQAILADVPPPVPATARAARMASVSAGPRGSTALGSGTVQGDALDTFMARTRQAESSGLDNAQPRDKSGRLLSSAVGRYQFTEGTWLSYYSRRFGTGGLTRSQILGKRLDGRIQDVLMRDLTEDNAGFLRQQGETVTPGNLYLTHFAGQGGARRLFEADPQASAAAVLGREAAQANPFLQKMTVGELLGWADRKMGGNGVAVRGAAPQVSDPAAIRAGLQSEIDRLHAESAAIEAELTGAMPRADDALDDVGMVPVLDAVDLPPMPRADAAPTEPLAQAADAPPVETMAILPRLRDIVADKGRNLNALDELATDLGVTEPEVRTALLELAKAKGGGVRVRRKDGAFVRRAAQIERAAPSGPEDVLDFIARKGGIRDDEGHQLGLKGLSKRQKEAIISDEAAARAIEARKGGGRNWQRMTRGGPLLRYEGLNIDAVGELLWEAGYFGNAGAQRPDINAVMDLIERRVSSGNPVYALEDMAGGAGAQQPGTDLPADLAGAERIATYGDWIADEAERVFGVDRAALDPEFLDYAATLKFEQDLSEGEAFMRAVNAYADAARWDALDEGGDISYEDLDYEWPFDNPPTRSEDIANESDFAGYEPVSGDEAAGGGIAANAGSGAGQTGPDLIDLPHAEVTRYLDPDGPATKAQLDSLDHDARAAVDPNVAAVQGQRAQLGAQAPLRAGVEQDGTMGLGLFDAGDQPTFQLDLDGTPRTVRDMLDEFDAEAAEIKNARDCL